MKDQEEFSIGGMVSVWIGNFQSDAQFDDYMNLSKDFEKDFGFRINNRSIREAAVESAPKLIEEVVNGFSNWKSFAPAVVEAAREDGVERAWKCPCLCNANKEDRRLTRSLHLIINQKLEIRKTMGLDSIEIVIGWEESFGISISDDDAVTLRTPSLAINLIANKLGAQDAPLRPCLTARAFHRTTGNQRTCRSCHRFNPESLAARL